MIVIRRLTSTLRKRLKKPLGILIQGSLDETMEILKAMIDKEKPPKIVTVGDQVSQDLPYNSIMPDVLIVDNRIMRKEIAPIPVDADIVMNVKNPAGTITDEAWSTIEKATNDARRTKIVVDGEEDLLTLVAISSAPDNSLIVYGQPKKGIVVVKATSQMKQRVRKMVDAMESRDN